MPGLVGGPVSQGPPESVPNDRLWGLGAHAKVPYLQGPTTLL